MIVWLYNSVARNFVKKLVYSSVYTQFLANLRIVYELYLCTADILKSFFKFINSWPTTMFYPHYQSSGTTRNRSLTVLPQTRVCRHPSFIPRLSHLWMTRLVDTPEQQQSCLPAPPAAAQWVPPLSTPDQPTHHFYTIILITELNTTTPNDEYISFIIKIIMKMQQFTCLAYC